MRVLLVRHGESIANKKNIIQGHSEYPLSEDGKQQSKALGEELKKNFNQISCIYSSDQMRSVDTAKIIADILGISNIIYDKRLREFDCGVLTGKEALPELQIHYDRIFGDYEYRITDGETINEVLTRVREFFDELIQTSDKNSTVLVVNHVWTFYLTFKHLLDIVPDSEPWFKYCLINLIEKKSPKAMWKILMMNGEEYLE